MTRSEHGQMAPLILGFCLILATLVVVVTNASAAFLQRQSLASLADGAAIAASDALVLPSWYQAAEVELTTAAAREQVNQYLVDLGASVQFPGLRVQQIQVTQNRVSVQLAANLDLPFPAFGSKRALVSSRGSALLILPPA